jgi:hypothetical protein
MIWPEKLYLAAAYERAGEMRGARDVLEAMGYTVTSRWIDQQDGETEAAGQDSLADNPAAYARYAEIDLEDLRAANVIIHFTGGGRGGRHTEFGAAIAWGKHLVLVGPREHVFHALPWVDWYPDWSRLMMALEPRRPFSDLL